MLLSTRFHLLKRFSMQEIPSSLQPLLLITATTNSSPPLLRPPTPNRSNLLFFHHNTNTKKKQWQPQAAFFSTTEEASSTEATSSLFSSYLSVRVCCNKDDVDLFSEALLCFGATSASTDESDNCQDIDDIWITSIFADGHDVHTCISQAAASVGMTGVPNYEVSKGNQCDWLSNIQVTFNPIKITDGLWIVPKWITPPDSHAINIILDPGLAFGTGHHPTTRMCLLLLHSLVKGGERLLDYGTGTGVLGIAAVKMGVKLSVGIDIDPHAVASARQNIALNEIDCNKMSVFLVPIQDVPKISGGSNEKSEEKTSNNLEHLARESFDIVIANILLNPLMDLVEDIVGFGKPGAVIGLSGILSEQLPQIKELYSLYLEKISVSEMDGWVCLHGTKRRF